MTYLLFDKFNYIWKNVLVALHLTVSDDRRETSNAGKKNLHFTFLLALKHENIKDPLSYLIKCKGSNFEVLCYAFVPR